MNESQHLPRPRAAAEDLKAGEMVGEYRLTTKVAEGGMGTVYAATHPVIGKKAAVKVLRRALCTNQEVLARFVDEARAVNQIRHANIVDVFAYGMLGDGRSYFVMEWLDGCTLSQAMAAGTLDAAQKLEVLTQLCGALEAAHQKGIVHRDIKPDNVFLVQDRDGVFVKLLDFGVAKLGAVKHASEEGSVLGTPAYISPEQASAHEVDHRTDIYSLGIIAYEMFAGRRPFDAGSAVELLTLHIHRAPPPPRSLAPAIAPALEALILRMLAKDREQRPELGVVRRVLSQLAAATALAAEAARGPRAGGAGNRPVLLRRFPEVAALAHPLMAELSRGVAWVEAEGTPAPGTPIVIRFAAEAYGAAIDFAGLVVRGLGGGGKTLLRYDRVERQHLERIFAVLAGAETTGAAEQEARAQWTSGTRDATEIAASALARFPVEPLGVERADDGPAPPKRGLFGLSARVLALTVLVAMAAVLAVTFIALDRARIDRRFYVQELNTRTSQLLADLLVERLAHFKARLTVASLGGVGGAFDLGELTSLAMCDGTSCDTLAGPKLDNALLDRARGGAGQELALFPACAAPPCPGDQGLVIAASAKQRTAVATLPSRLILDERRIPEDLAVFVLDDAGSLLASRAAHGVSGRLQDHPITRELGQERKSRTQAREYQAADGTPMLGAWSRAGKLVVLVVAPARLSEEAIAVLAREVSLVAALALAVAALVAVVFARTMTRQLRKLTAHASRVASGDFGASLAVPGRDEVGQLATSFDSMTRALKERDADVLRIRDKMSDDESAALQHEMSEWLETDLAGTLSRIQEVVQRPVSAQDPVRDLAQRRQRLEALSAQAQASLQHALAFVAIAGRRIDLAATVEDAIAYSRTALSGGTRVVVDFEAPNAVLFPRVLARESEIRDVVQALIERCARRLQPSDRLQVSLIQRGGGLELMVRAPRRSGVHEALASALHATQAIIEGHGAEARLAGDERALAALIRFPLDAKTPVHTARSAP